MDERNWQDEGAADWPWHLVVWSHAPHGRLALTGRQTSRSLAPDGDLFGSGWRVALPLAILFEPTEVISVPLKKRGRLSFQQRMDLRADGRKPRHKGRPKPAMRNIVRPLFRGYAFVSPCAGVSMAEIAQADGVGHVVSTNEIDADGCIMRRPWVARGDLMARLFDRERDPDARRMQQPEGRKGRRFAIGQVVRVADGPFSACQAVIETLDTDARVRVLVEMFGRATSVHLEEAQLEAV